MDFKARMDPDSPLVQHLLIAWQQAWQPRHPFPCTYEQALVGLRTGNYRVTALRQGAQPTELYIPARLMDTAINEVVVS